MAEGPEETDGDSKSNAKRRRLKGLLNKIQDLVEFYLGDANLPKDKFLQEKLKEHPEGYISLELITSFNKMKSLTSDLSLVVQAVGHSTKLQLSEDKQWVKRTTPLPVSSDADLRTIYIESLPSHASHDFIRNALKRFGTISYISLPKHKNSVIKGFAFVEFSTTQEAQDALTFFKSCQQQPSNSVMEVSMEATPLEVSMEATLLESHSGGQEATNMELSKQIGTISTAGVTTHGDTPSTAGVMTHGDAPSTAGVTSSGDAPSTAGVTTHGDAPSTAGVTSPGDAPSTAGVTTHGDAPSTAGVTSPADAPSAAAVTTHGNAPSTAGVTSHGDTIQQTTEGFAERHDENKAGSESEDASSGVGVKRRHQQDEEGPALHPKRRKMESLSEGEAMAEGKLESCEEAEEGGGRGNRKKRSRKKKKQPGLQELNLRVMSKMEWLEMKHLFAQMQKEQLRKLKDAVKVKPSGDLEKPKGFVPHTLVKVVSGGEATVQMLKKLCSQYGNVAYVDFNEGDKEGYVRFASPGCVEKLLTCQPPQGVVLQGVDEDGERAYYLKTQAARKQHRLHNIKKKHIRGKEKVISKALQNQGAKSNPLQKKPNPPPASQSIHLRFSDDEESSVRSEGLCLL